MRAPGTPPDGRVELRVAEDLPEHEAHVCLHRSEVAMTLRVAVLPVLHKGLGNAADLVRECDPARESPVRAGAQALVELDRSRDLTSHEAGRADAGHVRLLNHQRVA